MLWPLQSDLNPIEFLCEISGVLDSAPNSIIKTQNEKQQSFKHFLLPFPVMLHQLFPFAGDDLGV